MNSKKLLTGIVIVIIALGGFFTFKNRRSIVSKKTNEQAVVEQKSTVTLIIDSEDDVATYSGIQATTAFEALSEVAVQNSINLKTKQYDFGVFVESIGEKENTSDRAWIYYVNGASGEVAADKRELNDGDIVEWRYVKPEY